LKQLLNTLYVTTQGAYLAKDGDAVAVRVEQETKLRVPIHTLGSIVCFGQISCSPFLMGLCGEHGVALAFLTEKEQFLARVHGRVQGNVLLRRSQYRKANSDDSSAVVARAVVLAKVANCRTVLQRSLRDKSVGGGGEEIERAVRRLGRLLEDVAKADKVDEIRGHEGDAARVYFSVFDHLITASKDEFFFEGRNRRPPRDNVNALLSFTYTLLTHDVTAALEAVGLDPAVGYLHRDECLRMTAIGVNLSSRGDTNGTVVAQWENVGNSGRDDTADGAGSIQDIVDKCILLGEIHDAETGVDAQRGRALGLESEVHVEDAEEAPNQQAGANEQNAGEGEFGNDEPVAHPGVSLAAARSAAALLQAFPNRHRGDAKRGQQAK
jgi:CRISPR-associated endonuclease Cas1